MPTFSTPDPIRLSFDLVAGDVRVVASERADTVVKVTARDESNEFDVKAIATTRVDYSDGKLTIKAARSLQTYFTRRGGTIDVTVLVPVGSHVRGSTAMGDFLGEGRLGDCSLKTSAGDIRLDSAKSVHLTTLHGQIAVDTVAGDSNVTGSGEVRLRAVEGRASVRNLNGDSWIGEVTGSVSLSSAHGHIFVGRAGADVSATTAFGNVRVGDVARGSVVLQSASGELEIGIREGSAAWLEVKSGSGRVRNSLDITDGPAEASEKVQVRARTYDGDILIRRATK